jgi:hypothetical protein
MEEPGWLAKALNAALKTNGSNPPVAFVAQAQLPVGEAYEAYIRRTACVPTRDVMHDMFNGLVWSVFSAVKRQLNRLQAHEIESHGVGAIRGAVRDAATVFDENGAIFQAPPELWLALERRDWGALFLTHRALWRQARLILVGHALMEQLLRPRKPLTAHVIRWAAPLPEHPPHGGVDIGGMDAGLAPCLTADWLASKPFLPLPVLGVPGWWPANEDPDFYADAGVFRPPRAAQAR